MARQAGVSRYELSMIDSTPFFTSLKVSAPKEHEDGG